MRPTQPRGPAVSTVRLQAADLKEAIFGSFDGMTSTLGVVAGLLATHASASKIVAASIGIAVAATVGMGAGQYLSDGQRNLRNAVVMALATLSARSSPPPPSSSATRERASRLRSPSRRSQQPSSATTAGTS
jgi:hypothetical protein